MRFAIGAVLGTVACFSKPPPPGAGDSDSGVRDAPSIHIDAPPPACAHYSLFSAGVMLPVSINSAENNSGPMMSTDELELVFARDGHIFDSTRTTTAQPWGTAHQIVEDGSALYSEPWLSTDRMTLTYGCGANLCRTTRSQTFIIQPSPFLMNGSAPSIDSMGDNLFFTFTNAPQSYDFAAHSLQTAGADLKILTNGDYASSSLGGGDRSAVWIDSDGDVHTVDFTLNPLALGTTTSQALDPPLSEEPFLSADGRVLLFSNQGKIFQATRSCE